MFFLHDAINQSLDIYFFAIDKDCNYLFANELYKNVTGLNIKEGERFPIEKFYREADVSRFYDTVFPTVLNGESMGGEVALITKNDYEILLRFSSFPVKNEAGDVISFASFGIDIAHEKEMETTAKRQRLLIDSTNERLQIALDLSCAGTWEVHVAEKILTYDERFANMLKLPPSPITISEWTEHLCSILDVNLYPELIDYLRNHFDGTQSSEYRGMRFDFSDGSFIYTNCTSKNFCDEKGNPERLLGVTWDTTLDVLEHMSFDEIQNRQLRIQNFISQFSVPFTQPYQFDSLMNNALHDIQAFLGTDRACIYEFQADRSLLCTYECIKQSSIPSLLGVSFEYSSMKPLYDVITKYPYYYKKKTEDFFKKFPLVNLGAKSMAYIPILINGERSGYLVLSTMFEQANLTEDELRLALMVSSILAGAFSKRKNENELKEATMIAQNANTAKTQFLSNMSHEIRTPMNAILGMTQLADRTNDVNELKAYIDSIKSSSSQLLSIINDILDISKIESGKLELNSTVFSIERLIIKVCSLISERATQKGLHINIHGGDNLRLRYTGDDVRISQILTNLLSNAVKFTSDGGDIYITVDEISRNENNAILEISVRDTGIGMTKEQIERVFNSFEQADGSISRRFGGTGLGLTISKTLVELMGGSIKIESEPQKGSTFTFTLTLNCADEEEAIVYKNVHSQLKDLKILLLSANEVDISKFNLISKRMKFKCDVARSSDKALDMIMLALKKDTPYSTIFFDLSLNDENVIENFKNALPFVDINKFVPIIDFNSWNKVQDEIKKYTISKYLQRPLLVSPVYDALMNIVYNTKTDGLQKPVNIFPDFSSVNLLLAEDIEINSTIFCSLLEETKVNIDIAENGELAVEMFKCNPSKYDIIIMDIQMPKMDGLDATRAIRSLGLAKSKTIPIIAMTANAFKEDVDKCIAAGMNDHMPKPIDTKVVIDKIKRYLL